MVMMLIIGVETGERQRQEIYGAERKKNAEEIDGMIKKRKKKGLGR